ncbi:virulence factor lipase N-terminal [Thalassolituus maritimus]|uniref:Virulence factor lipase N-terminal n=1 Tax=Thalassolituus maritimus TaxID=484498 RepID=A0A1N7MDH4_9GAMM|nr:hypothetical protein [Thalassolituus maritimus]SIS84215.1 virulence factor lipase N-terminal [Thalassolituus maritimus]
MVKKTLLSLAIAATAAGLAGCNTGGDYKVDTGAVTAGSDGSTPSRITPIFSAANSQLPLNTDLVFASASATDGTAATADTTPPVTTALNDLPGFSTTATFYIPFNGLLDADTVVAGQSVFLIALKNSDDNANIDALDIQTILANTAYADTPSSPFSDDQPVAGTDYMARYVELGDGSTPSVAITPMTPLSAKTKYLVVLTDGIQSVSGKAVATSAEYELVSGNLGLPSPALQPVRDAVQGWETLSGQFLEAASGGTLSKDNIVLNYAFTTDGSLDVLTSYANPAQFIAANLTLEAAEDLTDEFAGGQLEDIVARKIATGGSSDPSTLNAVTDEQIAGVKALAIYPGQVYGAIASADISSLIGAESAITLNELVDRPEARSVAILDGATVDGAIQSATSYTGGASPDFFIGDKDLSGDTVTRYYQGQIELPDFLGDVTLTTELTASGISAAMAADPDWSANTTVGAVLDGALGNEAGTTPPKDDDESTNVTYRYPFPEPQENNNIAPLLVTMPDQVDYSAGGSVPGTQDCSGLTSVPVVIYVHGITGSRGNAVPYSAGLAANCIATVAIDLPLHGVAPITSDSNGDPIANQLLPLNMEYALAADTQSPWAGVIAAQVGGGSNTFANIEERHGNVYQNSVNARVAMEFGAEDAGTSGSTFINLSNFTRTRDNLRQAVVDLLNLNASIGNVSDAVVAAGAALELDETKVFVAGHSLGAIVATTFAAVNNSPAVLAANTNLNEVQGVILANGGANLTKLLENSPSFGPVVVGGLAASGVTQGTENFEKFMYVFQSAVDVADPANSGSILAATDTPVVAFNMVGGNALPGDASGISYPDGFKAAGVYLPDHTVPNSDYFADSGTNPYAAFASALGLPAGIDTAFAPLAGTQGLTSVLDTEAVTSTTTVGDLASPLRAEVRFASGTHSTFANSDDSAVFLEMLGQSVSLILGSYTVTNTAVLESN